MTSKIIMQLCITFCFAPARAQQNGVIYTNASQASSSDVPEHPVAATRTLGRRLSLTSGQEHALVDKHNTLRGGVTTPCTAADMGTLVWDSTLATESAQWAAKCQWKHDPENGNKGWGENLAMSWSSQGSQITTDALTGFVQAWYDEVVDAQWTADGAGATSKVYSNPQSQCKSYDSGTGKCMIGHYTQVVWAKSNKVGCAAIVCNSGLMGSGGLYLVCKYTPAGNLGMNSGALTAPWIAGAPCAACPNTCSHGKLCDVGSTPVRCKDTITTMNFNGVDYTDCASLKQGTESFGTDYWCKNRETQFKICQLSCSACTVPDKIGLSFCGQGSSPTPPTPGVPSPTPSPEPTTTTNGTSASAAQSWRLGVPAIPLIGGLLFWTEALRQW